MTQINIGEFVDNGISLEVALQKVKDAGYVVISSALVEDSNVTSIRKLVDFFYNYLQYRNPQRKIHYAKSITIDMQVAKRLIDSRMSLGMSRKRAMQEAVGIVKALIDNEEMFRFNLPISSFEVLRGGRLRWVIDKAITIYNGDLKEVEKEKLDRLYNRLDSDYEAEFLKSVDQTISGSDNI